FDHVGTHHRSRPGYGAAPIVADDPGTPMAERLDQIGGIADQLVERVVRDPDGCVGFAVTAHLGCDAIEAVGQRAYLMAPRVPAFRKPVHHDDRRPCAGASDSHRESTLESDFFEAPGFRHGRDVCGIRNLDPHPRPTRGLSASGRDTFTRLLWSYPASRA